MLFLLSIKHKVWQWVGREADPEFLKWSTDVSPTLELTLELIFFFLVHFLYWKTMCEQNADYSRGQSK